MITAGPRNRIGPVGPRGPIGPKGQQGDPGPKGDTGDTGDSPEFQWRGTEIRFRKPDGAWGKWVDLKGKRGPVGMTGPQGIQGPPAELIEFDTNVSTQPGDPVVITGSNFVEKIADNSSLTMPNGIFGFGFAKESSTKITVLFLGKLQQFSGLTVGAAYFISTIGGITITPPSTGMVQQIGFAMASDTLLVNLKQPMRRM